MTIPKQLIRRNELIVAVAMLFKENSFDPNARSYTGYETRQYAHQFNDKEGILKKSLASVGIVIRSLGNINQPLFALM